MSQKIDVKPDSELELVICRLLDIPPEKAYKAWTDPKLFPEWFCPKPWKITKVEMDLRPGGSSFMIMQGPDGTEVPLPGVYLEVIPNKKIVFTDAFTKAWEPSNCAFMVATVTFEDVDGKTKYTARARHWNKENYEKHKQMGFEEGWGTVADQLEALMKRL
jgi:uncharacterized protein YndB with AHSA1/START domain